VLTPFAPSRITVLRASLDPRLSAPDAAALLQDLRPHVLLVRACVCCVCGTLVGATCAHTCCWCVCVCAVCVAHWWGLPAPTRAAGACVCVLCAVAHWWGLPAPTRAAGTCVCVCGTLVGATCARKVSSRCPSAAD
jgi:hypothetical protein